MSDASTAAPKEGLPITVTAPSPGKYRWLIMWLLFAAMVINYVDRQMIGVLKPTLEAEFGWTEMQYADLIFWFQAAYAVSYLAFGRIIDRVGARWGFGAAFLIWHIGHIFTAGAREMSHFIAARVVLGVGEGGGFPGGIKAVTEWFPKKERALATGLFNAGTNIGAIVTPLIVPGIVLAFGWQMAFIITGVLGLIWLPIWLLVYRTPREQKRLSPAELAYIEQDPADPVEKVKWTKLLTVKETWAYALGKFLIDPIWWMFLFWLPDFLGRTHGLDLRTFGIPLVIIYLMSDVGSVGGGWLSSRLMHRGMSVNRARKTTMLICALLAVPVMFAAMASQLWVAVLIIGLATAAHQGFSANLYSLPGDVFPRSAVGSVVGIGGMVGAIGGMAMAKYAGYVLESIGTYTPIFIVAGSAYLIALAVVHFITPDYAPAKV